MEKLEQQNKYYQPQLEEFCVGFEFEFQDIEYAQWVSDIYKLNWTVEDSGIEDYLDWGNVRVKYLDSQDIIDCGFINVKTYSDELLFQKNISAFEFIELTLHLDEDYNITIEKYCQSKLVNTVLEVAPDNHENYIIFRGTIKNKHELKTILKQIGVF